MLKKGLLPSPGWAMVIVVKVVLSGSGACFAESPAPIALPVIAQKAPPPSAQQTALEIVAEEGRKLVQSNGKLTLTIKLSREPMATEGQLKALVVAVADRNQKIDMSQHLTQSRTSVEFDFTDWPLRQASYELRLYIAGVDGIWRTVGNAPFDVSLIPAAPVAPSASGVKPFDAKLDITVTSQVQEKVSGSQRPSTRPTYSDISVQGNITTNNSGDDWELKSQIQLAGSSFRPQAVSYGKLNAAAPKVDIPSYLIESSYRDTRFNLGHISVDVHPLLLSGISNRGFALLQKLPLGVDLGITAQNGESVVGYRNLVGLANRENQFRSLGLGYDIEQNRPGFFRVDVNVVEARVYNGTLPDGKNQGDPVSDRSRGVGTRLLWRNEASTLRIEGIYARSTFMPGIVPVNFPDKNNGFARTFEAGYDLLKEKNIAESLPLSVNFGVRNEFSSPHYRSLGAGYSANYNLNVQTATAKLGAMQAQLQLTQRYDNVARERIYMRNRVTASGFNLSLPIGPFFGENLRQQWVMASPVQADSPTITAAPQPSKALPTLTFSQSYTHGFGDRGFVPLGYFVDDLPDVYIVNRALGMQWQFDRVSFGLKANKTDQHNRQATFESQSTIDRRYSMSVDWKALDSLSLSLAYDPTYNYRFDTNIRADARQLRGSVNWTINEQWQMQADLNHSADFDDVGTKYNRANTSQIQVTRRFVVPLPGWKNLPGSAYMRIAESRGFNFTQGSPALDATSRRIQFGLTLSVF